MKLNKKTFSRILALTLSFTVFLSMSPVIAGNNASANDDSGGSTVLLGSPTGLSHWENPYDPLPTAQKTYKPTDMPIQITAGETVRLEAGTYDGNSIHGTDQVGYFLAPITIVGDSGGGVCTKIIFEGDTTIIGKNGDGSSPGTAGIRILSENAKLHLMTTGDYDITIKGGNAGNGADGKSVTTNNTQYSGGAAGGDGGGGAGAGIGTEGGKGGLGARATYSGTTSYIDDHEGEDGYVGIDGQKARTTSVTVRFITPANYNIEGGATGNGGNGGTGGKAKAYRDNKDEFFGGGGGSLGNNGGMSNWDDMCVGGAGGKGGTATTAGATGKKGVTESDNQTTDAYGGAGADPASAERAKGGVGALDLVKDYYNGGDGGSGGGAGYADRNFGIKIDYFTGVTTNFEASIRGQGFETVANWESEQTGYNSSSTPSLAKWGAHNLSNDSHSADIYFNGVTEYKYTGVQIRPGMENVHIPGSCSVDGCNNGGIIADDIIVDENEYGTNINAGTGTMVIRGKHDAEDYTTIDYVPGGSFVGAMQLTFDIAKADITQADITQAADNVYVGAPLKLSIDELTFASGTENVADQLRESTQTKDGPVVKWEIVSGGKGSFTTEGSETQFIPTETGIYTIKATLTDMNNFNDYVTAEINIDVKAKDIPVLTLSNNSPHPGEDVTVTVPGDLNDATYQWYADDTAINGATEATYIASNKDIGKKLSVKVTPDLSTQYSEAEIATTGTVEDHIYDSNGFCTECGAYEPASKSGDTYQISNAGNLFWFAALVNGDDSKAVFDAQDKSADAVLTQNIDLAGHDWTPIGGEQSIYVGTFDGNGNTISNLTIANAGRYSGMFGYSNGVIKNFTLTGNITVTDPATGKDKRSVAGIVGRLGDSSSGGTVSNVMCGVNININEDGYTHIGGIVGSLDQFGGKSIVEKCAYTGDINATETISCVGGIAGYSQYGTIQNCYNLGDITGKTSESGGILGYCNSSLTTVANCYNYGTISIGESESGAVIGANKRSGQFTNCYWLEGSATSGVGSGNDTSGVKNADQFASGEVCYLLNGQVSDGTEIWKQDVDTADKDLYPVFEGPTVYKYGDDIYTNEDELVCVNVSWGSMEFDYVQGAWDPDTHIYSGSWTAADAGANKITVKNIGNVSLDVDFAFNFDEKFEAYNLAGTFTGIDDGNAVLTEAETVTTNLKLTSLKPDALDVNSMSIGEVTVTIKEA